jgi:hypothetical protein
MLKKHPARHFFGTALSAEVLKRVEKRLKHIAKHKKNEPVGSTPAESETVQDEQPEDIKPERPVQDAEELRP